MPIQWKTDFALGNLELDGLLAVVHDAICEGRVPDISAVLEGVRSSSSRHFACEEAFMARSGYLGVEEHRARHEAFIAQLARFEDARASKGASMPLAMEIGNWLVGWVRDHHRYDLRLAAHAGQACHNDAGGKAR